MGKPRNHKPETPSLRETYRLRGAVFNKIKQEKLFPKKSRWAYAEKIFHQVLDYQTAVIEANDPKVQTIELRNRRYTLQQIALGKLSALDVMINSARDDLGLPAGEFDDIEDRIEECQRLLNAWVKSDEQRYGPPPDKDLLDKIAALSLTGGKTI